MSSFLRSKTVLPNQQGLTNPTYFTPSYKSEKSSLFQYTPTPIPMSSNPNFGADNPYDPRYRDPDKFKREIAELATKISGFEAAIAAWEIEIARGEERDSNVDEIKKQKAAHEASVRKLRLHKGMKEAELQGGATAALAYHDANQHLL